MTVIFWAVAVVAFVILELATVGLASIWFALGALFALIAALLGAPLWLQIVWFAVVSVATLLLTRPLAKKYINAKTMATNADRVIGGRAVVKERIDDLAGTGAVLADGKMWSARTADGSTVDPKYYRTRPGSLVLTLSPGYLDTLAPGEHPAVLSFTDGTAETVLVITAPVPKTGDGASPALWILCVCLGLAALGFLLRVRRPAGR